LRNWFSDLPGRVYFLSGGVDSSIVTALIQKESSRRVKTFTIGFNSRGVMDGGHPLCGKGYSQTHLGYQEPLLGVTTGSK